MTASAGLYQHVRDNDRRSVQLFAGFLLAVHLMAIVVLFIPLAMFDASHAPFLDWGGYARRYLLPFTAFAALIFAARLWWTVNGVRRDTGFRYVDSSEEPRLCRILEPLIIAAGIKTPYVGVIDSPALNAFACGIRARDTVVVVTRGLIDGLDDDELEAVLAHELMHIRHKDTRLMAAANAFMSNLTWLRLRGGMRVDDYRNAIGLIIFPVFVPILLATGLISQLAFRIGYCSRALIGSAREFIADAEAIRLTQKPHALVSALQKVEGRSAVAEVGGHNDAMLIAGDTDGPATTHPAMRDRIAALVATTGSMSYIAPVRADTRPAAQRGGFGQRGLTFEAATAAAAAPRATWIDIFRRTADPERNIFGLTGKGMIIVAVAFAGFVALNWKALDRDEFVAERLNLSVLGGLGEATTFALKCQVMGMTGGAFFKDSCTEKGMDHATNDLMVKMGLPKLGNFRPKHETEEADFQGDNRCFSRSYHDWPRDRLLPLDATDKYGHSMAFYTGFAAQPIPGIDFPLPRDEADKALASYFETRLLMTDHVYYFFGRPGLDAFNAALNTPHHWRALEALTGRMAYEKIKFQTYDRNAILAYLNNLQDFVPCGARRTEAAHSAATATPSAASAPAN